LLDHSLASRHAWWRVWTEPHSCFAEARPSHVQARNGPGSDSSCKPSVVPSLKSPVRILLRVRPLCGAGQAGATLPFSDAVHQRGDLQYPRTAALYESVSTASVAAGQMHNIVGHHNSIAGTKPGLRDKPRGSERTPCGPPGCCGGLVGAVAPKVPAGNTTVATPCLAAGLLVVAVGATVPDSRVVLQTVFAEADGLQPGKAQPAFFSPEKLILAGLRAYDLRQCGRRNLGTLSQEWRPPPLSMQGSR